MFVIITFRLVISLKQSTMCVLGKVIYLRVWKMRAGLPVVMGKVTRGHFRSSSMDISPDEDDLTKNFDQVCVWYHWGSYRSRSLTNGYRDVGSGVISHQRLLKVTNQGHLKR